MNAKRQQNANQTQVFCVNKPVYTNSGMLDTSLPDISSTVSKSHADPAEVNLIANQVIDCCCIINMPLLYIF